MKKNAWLIASFCSGSLLFGSASAELMNWSFAGSFGTDEDIQLFSFTLDAQDVLENTTTDIFLVSYGYGGGTQAANPYDSDDADPYLVTAGGFDTVISLFSEAGTLLGWSDDGETSCFNGAETLAPATDNGNADSGLTYDACLQSSLQAGTYYAAFSHYENYPFYEGYDDEWNYVLEELTLADWLGSEITLDTCNDNGATGFCDQDGNLRTSAWNMDILGATEAHIITVPEPTTLTLLAFGLLGVGSFATRRRNKLQYAPIH
jgi:hypothetical protein